MIKKKGLLLFFCFLSILLLSPKSQAYSAKNEYARQFASLFPETKYYGTLSESGNRVRILEAEDKKHFWILTKQGERKKVDWEALIPEETVTPALNAVDGKTVAYFAGAMGFKSDTGYFLWTDLSRLKVYVLEYGDEGWNMLRALPCTAGDSHHPTPTGSYLLDYKCTCIGKENMYLCRYAMCFYGSYMFHSVLYDWGGKSVIDGRLGERVSHGCIRLSPDDSRWLYTTVPVGSTVLIR